jgi:exosortase
MTQTLTASRAFRSQLLAALAVVLLVVLWAHWTALGEAADRWDDPEYSHGYLVPGFALLLLWLRRETLNRSALRPEWWGLGLVAAAAGMRLYGAYYRFEWLDQIALLPALAGVAVVVGGLAALRWCWPAIVFLFFMIPLPHTVAKGLAEPLQRIATESSTFLLQTFGRPAVAESTLIRLNEVELNIIEACSGLRMLMIFFALSTAVAILIRKPLWERLLVCVSAIPIALAVNILRITATGILHEVAGKEVADAVFHDLAGWLMMPIALVFLGLELKLLKHLLIESDRPAPVPVSPPAPSRQRVFTTAIQPPPAAPAPAAPAPAAPAAAPAAAETPTAPAAPPVRTRRQRQPRPETAKPFGRG